MRKQRAMIATAITVAISGISFNASAADNLWTGGTSKDWNDPNNWSLLRVPVNPSAAGDGFDDAVVDTLTNFPVITANLSAVPRDIIVGNSAGATARVDHTAGTAATSGPNWFYVARNGSTATYNLANTAGVGGTLTGFALGSGQVNVGQRLYVGGTEFGAVGSVGTLNINTSGGIAVGNDLAVGTDGGTGVVNFDAGTVTTGGWNFIGKRVNTDGGNGTYNQSGGTLTNSGRTYIGNGNSAGAMNITGGTYNNTGDRFIVGENNFANTVATLKISGGTLNTALLSIGGHQDEAGKGSLTVSGTAQINAGEFWIGQHQTAQGTSDGVMTMTAGTVTTNNWFVVGRDNATGTLNLSGGSITKGGDANSHIIIGSLAGTGTVNQSGGSLKTSGGGDIRMGEGATGLATWNMSGGTAGGDALRIGWQGQLATLNLSGNGIITTGDVVLAENGTGIVAQSGGRLNAGGNVIVQSNAAQVGQYALSGGTLAVNGALNTTQGVFTFSGGTLTRGNAGIINVTGALTSTNKNSTLKLDTDKTFSVTGALDIAAGVTFDVTGRVIPNVTGTGSFALGTDGSIVGTFDPTLTTVVGLTTPVGATFISETAGEAHAFTAAQTVYWVQESAGQVTLQYSVGVPEPTSLGFLGLVAAGMLRRRRRQHA